MAIKRKLQVRYGAAASRPTLSTGEFGLDTDTGSEALYIGTPAGNKSLSTITLPSQTNNSGKFLTTNGTSASWANTQDEKMVTLFFYRSNPSDGDSLYLGGIAGLTEYKTRSSYTYARINGAFSGGMVFSAFASLSGVDIGFTFSINAVINSGGGSDQNLLTITDISGPSTIVGSSVLTDASPQTFAWATVELY